MVGDDRARHCSKCDKDVFDLSAMTTSEVTALLRSGKNVISPIGWFYPGASEAAPLAAAAREGGVTLHQPDGDRLSRSQLDKLTDFGVKGYARKRIEAAVPDRAAAGVLGAASLANEDLLTAMRELSYLSRNGKRFPVAWRTVAADELGGIYEGLLELHPSPEFVEISPDHLLALDAADASRIAYHEGVFRALGLAADEAFWGDVRTHLTDAEIVDLAYCTACWIGLGRVAHVLGSDTACNIPTHKMAA